MFHLTAFPTPGTTLTTRSDEQGDFALAGLPSGRHELVVTGEGYQPVRVENVEIEAGQLAWLPPQQLQRTGNLELLEPFVVQGRSVRMRPLDDSAALLGPRRATGNLDLPRTMNDALPYTIYTREQITRSGVVALNEFLQRVVLEGEAATQPPEQSGSFSLNEGFAGSSNLKLSDSFLCCVKQPSRTNNPSFIVVVRRHFKQRCPSMNRNRSNFSKPTFSQEVDR